MIASGCKTKSASTLTAPCERISAPFLTRRAFAGSRIGAERKEMVDFYFALGPDPHDVFVVVGEKWILYKHCETEDLARAIVDGQNKRREWKR